MNLAAIALLVLSSSASSQCVRLGHAAKGGTGKRFSSSSQRSSAALSSSPFPIERRPSLHLVGIGRGVDFLLYPLVIWLVREITPHQATPTRKTASASRNSARAVAIAQAPGDRPGRSIERGLAVPHSAGSSASTTA